MFPVGGIFETIVVGIVMDRSWHLWEHRKNGWFQSWWGHMRRNDLAGRSYDMSLWCLSFDVLLVYLMLPDQVWSIGQIQSVWLYAPSWQTILFANTADCYFIKKGQEYFIWFVWHKSEQIRRGVAPRILSYSSLLSRYKINRKSCHKVNKSATGCPWPDHGDTISLGYTAWITAKS